MLRMRLVGSVVVLLSSMVAVPGALAKGPPDRLTLAGPGLAAPVEVTDTESLQLFGASIHASVSGWPFVDAETRVPAPAAGPVYRLSLFYRGESDFVQYYAVEYVPDPAHELGYVHDSYLGGTGRWYRVTAEGERLMARLLPAPQQADRETVSDTAAHARSERPDSPPAAPTAAQPAATWGPLLAGLVAALALVGGVLALRRQRPHV